MIKRKTIALDEAVWARIGEYRFGNRVQSETEAVRRVIEAGLQALEGAAASAEMPSVKVVFGKRRGR